MPSNFLDKKIVVLEKKILKYTKSIHNKVKNKVNNAITFSTPSRDKVPRQHYRSFCSLDTNSRESNKIPLLFTGDNENIKTRTMISPTKIKTIQIFEEDYNETKNAGNHNNKMSLWHKKKVKKNIENNNIIRIPPTVEKKCKSIPIIEEDISININEYRTETAINDPFISNTLTNAANFDDHNNNNPMYISSLSREEKEEEIEEEIEEESTTTTEPPPPYLKHKSPKNQRKINYPIDDDNPKRSINYTIDHDHEIQTYYQRGDAIIKSIAQVEEAVNKTYYKLHQYTLEHANNNKVRNNNVLTTITTAIHANQDVVTQRALVPHHQNPLHNQQPREKPLVSTTKNQNNNTMAELEYQKKIKVFECVDNNRKIAQRHLRNPNSSSKESGSNSSEFTTRYSNFLQDQIRTTSKKIRSPEDDIKVTMKSLLSEINWLEQKIGTMSQMNQDHTKILSLGQCGMINNGMKPCD